MQQDDGRHGGAVERRLDVGHVVAADHGVARPSDLEPGGDGRVRGVAWCFIQATASCDDRRDERRRQRHGHQHHRAVRG